MGVLLPSTKPQNPKPCSGLRDWGLYGLRIQNESVLVERSESGNASLGEDRLRSGFSGLGFRAFGERFGILGWKPALGYARKTATPG